MADIKEEIAEADIKEETEEGEALDVVAGVVVAEAAEMGIGSALILGRFCPLFIYYLILLFYFIFMGKLRDSPFLNT